MVPNHAIELAKEQVRDNVFIIGGGMVYQYAIENKMVDVVLRYESGLDRFIHPNKGNFIGRDALVKWQQDGFDNKMVTLEVFDINDADALGNNAIYSDDKVIGRATGGNYGFRVKKSLAIAMVKPEFSKVGTELEMDILDKKHKVVVIEDSPYDPINEKIRA